jgi:osmotically-inducible protein OsmY
MDHDLAPADTMDTDLDLAERIHDAIHALDVLRGTRAHVEVTVTNGHATLEGVVQSPMAAVEVARAAADVAGGAVVTSHLLDDANLSNQVAEALATDPRTAAIPPGYEVNSTFGHLRLVGYFTPGQAQAAKAVCQSVHGVRSVAIQAL